MARVNNPVAGVIHCEQCGQVASLHETRRGKGRGLLYKRCACGCDQRTGEAVQKTWRQGMTPRPGFEHLKEAAPDVSENLTHQPEPEPETTEPDTVQQPAAQPAEPAPTPKGAALPLLAGLLGVGLLLLTAGRAGALPLA